MFNWIKNLTKNSPKEKDHRQTRIVKQIVPASQRQAEAEAEEAASRAAAEGELQSRKDALIRAKAVEAAKTAPTPISLVPNVQKSSPPPIAFPSSEQAATPPPVVRLAAEEPPPAVESAPPMVRLTTAKKKPALNFSSVPAASSTREIVLSVSDFVGKIPGHFVDEQAVSSTQEVRFDASDLYSDMTKGRATVPLSVIAEALPALFKRKITPEEDIEIQLPLPKIVAQMSDLFTRSDQEAPEIFEEVETPFLKAAQRDQALHKVSGAVVIPPAEVAVPALVIPVLPPTPPPAAVVVPSVVPATPAAPAELPRPKPVALKLSMTPPAASKPEETLPAVKKAPSSTGERRVTVRVRPLIQAMPIQQRELLLGSIAEDTQVDLPLDQIQRQLATGRVSLPLNTFSEALDPSLGRLFRENFPGNEVPISLSEIVKNLPNDSLEIRMDQMEQEVDPNEFETPFNTTPDTIASRPVAPSPLSAAIPSPDRRPSQIKPHITPAISNYTTRKLNNTSGKFPSPMHAALGVQDELDAKKVVKLASALPGVGSITVITEDGLILAGNLPSFMDPEGFSAMAPQLHRKMAAQAIDMKLGELKHLSLSTENHTVTIFTGKGMTLAVLHQNQSDLGHGVKEKFIAIVDGLAKQYNGPELSVH